MAYDWLFFLNSVLFGIGLAMDAFSVSLVRGLVEPGMRTRRKCLIAGTFALFQIGMPLIGWVFVHTLVERFRKLEKFTPWIALILLLYIGIQLIVEAAGKKPEADASKDEDESGEAGRFGVGKLLLMGIATSIDALSVGVTISELPWQMALVEALIIGLVTFGICLGGIRLGALFGTKFKKQAGLIGGVILILIGLELFIKGVFF